MKSSLPGLEMTSETLDCCGVVTLNGEVDLTSAPLVESHIEAMTEDSAKHLVVECEAMSFIDSTGIQALVRARQAVGGSLALVKPQRSTQRVLEIVGMSGDFPDFDTVEEARDYLHSSGTRLRAPA